MSACICPIDGQAAVYKAVRPIARKPHRCDECYRQIQPGERYERVNGLWEGQWDTYRTCLYCLHARDLAAARLECFCWEHGNLRENITDALADEQLSGLAFAIGRIEIERQGLSR